MFKVVVTGSRFWIEYQPIKSELDELLEEHRGELCVAHGDASGADSFADYWCRQNGVPVARFPALWQYFGRAAGVLRNEAMLEVFNPCLVLAFHADLQKSTGTKHCIESARKRNIKVKLIT